MSYRILLVDDDKELCEELREILLAEGYDMDLAYDGFKAKDLIENEAYGLVILDLKLPGVDGLVLAEVTKNKHAKTKVFIISGRPFIDDMLKEVAAKNLIDAVIKKPFNIDDLLVKIRGALE